MKSKVCVNVNAKLCSPIYLLTHSRFKITKILEENTTSYFVVFQILIIILLDSNVLGTKLNKIKEEVNNIMSKADTNILYDRD